jgi:hypothetical protein
MPQLNGQMLKSYGGILVMSASLIRLLFDKHPSRSKLDRRMSLCRRALRFFFYREGTGDVSTLADDRVKEVSLPAIIGLVLLTLAREFSALFVTR